MYLENIERQVLHNSAALGHHGITAPRITASRHHGEELLHSNVLYLNGIMRPYSAYTEGRLDRYRIGNPRELYEIHTQPWLSEGSLTCDSCHHMGPDPSFNCASMQFHHTVPTTNPPLKI